MQVIVGRTNKNQETKMSIKKIMFLSNLLLLPSFLFSSINFFNHPVRSSDEVKAGISKELQVFLDPALAETDRTIDGLLKLRKEAGLGKLEPYYGAIGLVASLASDAEEKFLLSMKNAGHSDVDEKEYKTVTQCIITFIHECFKKRITE